MKYMPPPFFYQSFNLGKSQTLFKINHHGISDRTYYIYEAEFWNYDYSGYFDLQKSNYPNSDYTALGIYANILFCQ